jgi:hypothetical protein
MNIEFKNISAAKAKRRAAPKQIIRGGMPDPILTPAARLKMGNASRTRLTILDGIVNDDERSVLERLALHEQILAGRTKSCGLEPGGGSVGPGPSPIPDGMLGAISRHVETLRSLDARPFEAAVLRAFVKIQNGEPGAQTPAQYGLKLCPGAGSKRDAFLGAVVGAARVLVKMGY